MVRAMRARSNFLYTSARFFVFGRQLSTLRRLVVSSTWSPTAITIDYKLVYSYLWSTVYDTCLETSIPLGSAGQPKSLTKSRNPKVKKPYLYLVPFPVLFALLLVA